VTGSGVNPLPAPVALSPSSALAGGAAFTLTVAGTNFVASSIVRWNGADRATTFVSDIELRAAIVVTDIATAGSAHITVFNPPPGGGTSGAVTFPITFADVPITHPFVAWIDAVANAAITSGCATSPPQYCPDEAVTRDQMAVFLLRGIHGGGFDPPAATGTTFADVPAAHPFAKWIEQLAREGMTGGCSTGPPKYCPDAGVTRAQIAVFLLRAKHGPAYQPPAAMGTIFTDVPGSQPFAAWIEQLAREGITGGCSTSPAQYCPEARLTRGQMAVLLVRAFNLPM
jgi:hypothetical protein